MKYKLLLEYEIDLEGEPVDVDIEEAVLSSVRVQDETLQERVVEAQDWKSTVVLKSRTIVAGV